MSAADPATSPPTAPPVPASPTAPTAPTADYASSASDRPSPAAEWLREHLPALTAGLASALILGSAGWALLPSQPDQLASLTADLVWLVPMTLLWAAAMMVAGALTGLLCPGPDVWRVAPTALCFGLLVARCVAPGPRISRIEPILAGVPGWPLRFAVECLLWGGLVVLGTAAAVAASRRRLGAGGGTDEADHPESAPDSPRAAFTHSPPVWFGPGGGYVRRLRPVAFGVASAVAAVIGLAVVCELARSENFKQALFAPLVAFWLAGALVQGFFPTAGPRALPVFVPALVGAVCQLLYGAAAPAGAAPGRDDIAARPVLFELPLDWTAAGGLGLMLGLRPGGLRELFWSITARITPLMTALTLPPTPQEAAALFAKGLGSATPSPSSTASAVTPATRSASASSPSPASRETKAPEPEEKDRGRDKGRDRDRDRKRKKRK